MIINSVNIINFNTKLIKIGKYVAAEKLERYLGKETILQVVNESQIGISQKMARSDCFESLLATRRSKHSLKPFCCLPVSIFGVLLQIAF